MILISLRDSAQHEASAATLRAAATASGDGADDAVTRWRRRIHLLSNVPIFHLFQPPSRRQRFFAEAKHIAPRPLRIEAAISLLPRRAFTS